MNKIYLEEAQQKLLSDILSQENIVQKLPQMRHDSYYLLTDNDLTDLLFAISDAIIFQGMDEHQDCLTDIGVQLQRLYDALDMQVE